MTDAFDLGAIVHSDGLELNAGISIAPHPVLDRVLAVLYHLAVRPASPVAASAYPPMGLESMRVASTRPLL
jgi:hypothetical protein